MPRPPLDPQIISLIENKWVQMQEPSAVKVWRKICEDEGGVVSVRKVQQVIADLKARRPDEVSLFVQPWQPWKSDTETPEETDYLLELRLVQKKAGLGTLSVQQAKWAKRIRISLNDLPDMRAHAVLSFAYLVREEFTNIKGRPETLKTDDLDEYLAHKPWLSDERRNAYDTALTEGIVPYPAPLFLGPSFRDSTSDLTEIVIRAFGLPVRLAHISEESLRGLHPEIRDDFEWILTANLGLSRSFFDFMGSAANGIGNEGSARLESDTRGEM